MAKCRFLMVLVFFVQVFSCFLLVPSWYISQKEISGPVSKRVCETRVVKGQTKESISRRRRVSTNCQTELASWFKLEKKTNWVGTDSFLLESVGHEPLVRVPCKKFCMVHERVVHARLIPKILFAQGPPTIRGSFARGSWTEDPWCNNSCDWKGCPRKAVGKTSRAEAQAKTRGTGHGVCDCSFGWAHPESWKEGAGATQSWLSFHLWETPGSPSSELSMDKLCVFLIRFCAGQFFLDSLSSTEGIKNKMYSWGKGHCFG